MRYDFSTRKHQEVYENEVRKRMEPPLNMSRTQAEMLVAVLMWTTQKGERDAVQSKME